VPRHLVGEARLEVTCGAGHDGLIISCLMNLSRVAAGAKAHGEVWHITERSKEGFLIVSIK
jgi:hypothetical protein